MSSTAASFAVLWDQDGVLVDSGDLHYESWQVALAEFGYSLDYETFARAFGMNNLSIIRMIVGDPSPGQIQQIGDRKEIVYRQMIPGRLQVLPGVRPWLERLSRQGVPMAVASSAPIENIDATLDALDLRRYFAATISVAGRPGKPDPLVFIEAAQHLGYPPERCIVVEDAIAGVEAAHRAGMKCIAVLTTNPAEALQTAELVVENLELLPEDAFQRLANS